jgi:uncharacterized RDD family membrane protein YckC
VTAEGHRELLTPEGVPLRLTLARAGDRIGAFAIDAFLIVAAAVVAALASVVLGVAARGMGAAVALLAFFLLRNFYFIWFECAWHGATPGKRALGLRVIDAHGGMLTPEAVFARNFMREVELFLPMVALLAPEALLPDVPAWLRYLSLAWLFVFALLPLFNRDRLRLGDLVGGTIVVRTPKAVLRPDLSAEEPRRGTVPSGIAFRTEQLDVYGIQELQVLESLLRQRRPNPMALDAVARKIQEKIGWVPPDGRRPDAGDFLKAFYTAQRARLEQRLLLGERRQRKRAGRLTRTP